MSKILMLSNIHCPHIGGVEIHTDRVASELVRRGHDVVVQCTTPGREGLTYDYKILRVDDDHKRFAPREHFDIIACQDFYTYSDELREFAPVVTMTFHGWEGRCPPEPSVVARRQEINEVCDGSIGVGLYIEKWYGTKCDAIIWGGVSQDDMVPIDKVEPCRFIWVGGLREDMDLVSYLELLAYLQDEEGWEPTLDIVGGGHPKVEEALMETAGSLGLKYCKFWGWREDYSELYEKASYVLSGGYLSMLKALANYKTVISLWGNPLKHDYVEWFPGRIISGDKDNVADIAMRIQNGIPPEVLEGNKIWATSQSWANVTDIYEMLWEGK